MSQGTAPRAYTRQPATADHIQSTVVCILVRGQSVGSYKAQKRASTKGCPRHCGGNGCKQVGLTKDILKDGGLFRTTLIPKKMQAMTATDRMLVHGGESTLPWSGSTTVWIQSSAKKHTARLIPPLQEILTVERLVLGSIPHAPKDIESATITCKIEAPPPA